MNGRRTTFAPWKVAALVLGAPLAGFAAVVEPTLMIVPLGVAVVLAALEAPVLAVGVFLLAHIATPIYLRVPIPGIHQLPFATTWMLLILGVAALGWLAGRSAPRRLGPAGRRAACFFLLFVLVGASSLIDPRTDTESLKVWAIAIGFPSLGFVLILWAAGELRDLRTLEVFLVAGGVAASIYAVLELGLGRNPLLDQFEIETVSGYYEREFLDAAGPAGILYRSFSVYLNPIEFGAVMGMLFPFAAVRMAAAESRHERLLFAAGAALIALGVVLSVSRGPLLGLAVATCLIGVLYRALRPWLLLGLSVGALGVLAAWVVLGEKLEDRLNDLDNVTLRLKLFQTAIAIFLDHPLRGIGIGNFPVYYLEAIREHHIGPFYELGGDRVEKVRVAENTYLQLAAETGLLGIAATTSAVVALVRLCNRLAFRGVDPYTRNSAIAILVSMIVYAINALTVTAYTLYGPTLLMVGVLPAMLLALDRVDACQRSGSTAP